MENSDLNRIVLHLAFRCWITGLNLNRFEVLMIVETFVNKCGPDLNDIETKLVEVIDQDISTFKNYDELIDSNCLPSRYIWDIKRYLRTILNNKSTYEPYHNGYVFKTRKDYPGMLLIETSNLIFIRY